MKIAVTTDLSDLTEVVIRYAVGLSKQINADLLLLYVVPSSIATGARVSSEMLKNEIMKATKEELEQLVMKFQDDEVNIEYHTCYGNSVAELIKSFVRNHGIDFLVMGSKEIEGPNKIFGSNTIAVINNSTVPVVVVPSKTFFQPIKKVVFATDFMNLEVEIEIIIPLLKKLQAQLYIVHVYDANVENVEAKKIITNRLAKVDDVKANFEEITGTDIHSAVDEYISENNADLLILFTHKVSLFQQLFDKSITREFAFHPHIPLLIINNR